MNNPNIRYWLEWKPSIISESLKDQPTKPTKPSSVSLSSGQISNIDLEPTGPELDQIDAAMNILNSSGARILPGPVLGIPSDRLTVEVRAAIGTLSMCDLPVVLLQGQERDAS